MQHRLMQTPVDTQAVLLLFHPSFTLAAMQRSGQQSCHGVLTLVSRPRPQLYTAIPRHTLPEGAQARAAGVIARAGVPSTQAVPPSCGKCNAWDSCKTKKRYLSFCAHWWAPSGRMEFIFCALLKVVLEVHATPPVSIYWSAVFINWF